MANPFHYGAPATGEQFVGRETELDALLARMRNGINVVLASPRRYGKTSLLIRAEQRLAADRPAAAVVATNVLVCRDLPTLAGRLVSAAYHVPGSRWARARQGLTEFLTHLRVRPSVTLDDAGRPRFAFDVGLSSGDADAVIGTWWPSWRPRPTGRRCSSSTSSRPSPDTAATCPCCSRA